MTHYRQMYDRDYLGSWDLPENKDVVVTIEHVKGGDIVGTGGKKSKKPVVSFVGKEKKFICNVTNAKAIAGLYGNHVEKWAGKRISLYVSTTRDPSTGGDTPCIRVRPQAPAAPSTAPSQAPAEEVAPTDTGMQI